MQAIALDALTDTSLDRGPVADPASERRAGIIFGFVVEIIRRVALMAGRHSDRLGMACPGGGKL